MPSMSPGNWRVTSLADSLSEESNGGFQMRSIVMGATLLALAIPAASHAAPASAKAKPPAKVEAVDSKKAPDLDIGQMMAIFDKIFPAQPDPPAPRLALSRTAVQSLFPDGTYARMMGGMLHGIADRVMSLTPADFGAKPGKDKAAQTMTLRQSLAKGDPEFDAHMASMEKIVSEEFAKMAAIIEPRMRDGLARSMARRFDEKQLADINAFLVTDSGKAFGAQSMAMYVDPDVMRAMIGTFPEMMKAMPEAMKRIEAEAGHLDKAKTDKAEPLTPAS